MPVGRPSVTKGPLMKAKVGIGLALTVFGLGVLSGLAVSRAHHVEWVADSLIRMQAITPGMTRADLLEVFTTEGGGYQAAMRTFVSRDCPHFKVDVQFRTVGGTAQIPGTEVFMQVEDAEDIITSISRPYLEFSSMD